MSPPAALPSYFTSQKLTRRQDGALYLPLLGREHIAAIVDFKARRYGLTDAGPLNEPVPVRSNEKPACPGTRTGPVRTLLANAMIAL